MKERDYYLAFALVNGIGPKTFAKLIANLGSAKKAWLSDAKELKKAGLGEKLIQRFEKFRKEFSFEEHKNKLAQKEASFIALCDKEYPKLLSQIPNPPIVLFVKGDPSILWDTVVARQSRFSDDARQTSTKLLKQARSLNESLSLSLTNKALTAFDSPQSEQTPLIAIVGTRKITNYGREVTKLFSSELSLSGVTIVSGLAMGVDAEAAWGALHAGGKTIAVLGNGVDMCFPSSNRALYDKILKGNGCIVSEFPLGQSPTVGSFPSRNRIIAGLSLGVLVTEGAKDSGSLITADYAFKFNRKVFAVPGPITSQLSVAPLRLIEKGAKLVASTEDILKELNFKYSKAKTDSKGVRLRNLSKDELKIVQLLENEGLFFDEIVRQSGISAAKLATLLSMMEIKGIIKSSGNGIYSTL